MVWMEDGVGNGSGDGGMMCMMQGEKSGRYQENPASLEGSWDD